MSEENQEWAQVSAMVKKQCLELVAKAEQEARAKIAKAEEEADQKYWTMFEAQKKDLVEVHHQTKVGLWDKIVAMKKERDTARGKETLPRWPKCGRCKR